MAHFSQFLEALVRANGLGDNITWLFYPGMLLDSYDKWWDDFGTLVLAHEGIFPLSPKVVFVYSHLEIKKEIVPGCRVEKNQIIGRTFDTSKKQSKLLSHLHFSCVELMDKIPLKNLNWDLFPDRGKVNLINPLFI
jgi:hypothetical protein